MEAVGYDLYCKMLNDAVLRLKGELSEDTDFDTTLDLNIDAFLPSAYIRNEVEKLELYKRISAIETKDELEDMQDELLDRFGDLPAAVVNLLHIALLKSMAHHAYMTDVKQKGEKVSFEMNPEANVQVDPGCAERISEGTLRQCRGASRIRTGSFIREEKRMAIKD